MHWSEGRWRESHSLVIGILLHYFMQPPFINFCIKLTRKPTEHLMTHSSTYNLRTSRETDGLVTASTAHSLFQLCKWEKKYWIHLLNNPTVSKISIQDSFFCDPRVQNEFLCCSTFKCSQTFSVLRDRQEIWNRNSTYTLSNRFRNFRFSGVSAETTRKIDTWLDTRRHDIRYDVPLQN